MYGCKKSSSGVKTFLLTLKPSTTRSERTSNKDVIVKKVEALIFKNHRENIDELAKKTCRSVQQTLYTLFWRIF